MGKTAAGGRGGGVRLTRFGIVGANPRRVSRLGRLVVERLTSAGAELVMWAAVDAEPPGLPDGLDAAGELAVKCPLVTLDKARRGDAKRIDFFLQLSGDPIELPAAHGVWRFGTGSPGPLAFWDVYDGAYHLEIRLEQLVGGDHRRTVPLDRRYLHVNRLSYAATLEQVMAEMAAMVVDAARRGLPDPLPEAVVFPPAHTDWPSGAQMAKLRAKQFSRVAADQYQGILYPEAWKTGVIRTPVREFLDMGYLPEIAWLPDTGSQSFLADPFLVRLPEGWLLLAEGFDFETSRGRIVQEFSANGEFTGNVEDAIVEPCHMSYPFPMEYEGELYCIPETHQLGGVFAWRWESASRKWVERREVLGGRGLIDSTLLEHEGRWWLFATDIADGVDSKLQLFYADSPWGPWQEHRRNPVKVDIRSSRPGGMPFRAGGHLYRPAQDSSKRYGWRLMLNLVTRLTPDAFEEETVRVMDSDRLGRSGVHTLSGAGELTVIDGWRESVDPARATKVFWHKLRRLAGMDAGKRS